MNRRRLGQPKGSRSPPRGSAAWGCRSSTEASDEAEAKEVIQRAIDLGVDFLDTADMYGPFTNEKLVGEAIASRRDEVVLATKFGNVRGPNGERLGVRGDPEYVQQVLRGFAAGASGSSGSTSTTSTGSTPNVPIEETVGAMAELVGQGKVGHLGLSEAAPETIRRAHAVHPITGAADRVLAVEPRPRGRDPADRARAGHRLRRLQPARPRLPYRPVPFARRPAPRMISAVTVPVFRTGTSVETSNCLTGSGRFPRKRESAPGQLALAWVLAQGDDIVPIPGTKHRRSTWSRTSPPPRSS